MKKYLFVLAVIVSIGVTAFTESKITNPPDLYYWFQVNPGYGDETHFNNDEAFYLSTVTQPSASAPTTICNSSGSYLCVIGFTEDQLVEGDVTLIDDEMADVAPLAPSNRKRSSE